MIIKGKNIDFTKQRIDLSEKKINDSIAINIAKELEQNTKVTKLDLSYNIIKYDGASAIAEMLKKNTTIRSIKLSKNLITYKGLKLLAESFKHNRTLLEISVDNLYLIISQNNCKIHIMDRLIGGVFDKNNIDAGIKIVDAVNSNPNIIHLNNYRTPNYKKARNIVNKLLNDPFVLPAEMLKHLIVFEKPVKLILTEDKLNKNFIQEIIKKLNLT